MRHRTNLLDLMTIKEVVKEDYKQDRLMSKLYTLDRTWTQSVNTGTKHFTQTKDSINIFS